MQAVGGLTGGSGSNGAAAATALPAAERARIEEAIEAAFTTGSGEWQMGDKAAGGRSRCPPWCWLEWEKVPAAGLHGTPAASWQPLTMPI